MILTENLFKTRKSVISGKGAFASRDILAGETICFMEGSRISLRELGQRIKEKIELEGNVLQIGDEIYIDMEEKFRCINHSCNPTAGIRKDNELIALKNIREEEEITYDYSTTMWENSVKIKKYVGLPLWKMKCQCGESNCRKVIGQFYDLPKPIQQKYFHQKAVPQFIVQKYL